MAFIRYYNKKGILYATVVENIRIDGKVHQKYIANLGRVIDKENKIFKNKDRGTYSYSIEGGYLDMQTEEKAMLQEKLILDFGDSYVLYEYLKQLEFYDVFSNILPAHHDTLFSMLFYRIVTDKKANYYAETWWEGNYARILFPEAKLQSQRVSDFLVRLGDEKVQREFFKQYLTVLYGNSESNTGILIDSTGLENTSKMSITQFNNHNGDISLEVRLIYVIDRKNGMPIYFRYCPGNIIDVTTLCTTVAELSQYGISIDYAIVDAGYFSEENVKQLYKNHIHFITRLAPNRKIFKETISNEISDIISSKYATRYGERLIYIKKVEVDVYGNIGYAYVGVDIDSRQTQYKRTVFTAMDDKLSPEDMDKSLEKLGLFMILSSDDMDVSEILPLYYTRQQVEQVFDIGKNNADLLPLRVHNEDTFRGHLMLTFMATAIIQRLQRDIIIKRKKGSKINPEGLLLKLRNQKCKVYDDNIIPQEAVKNINEIYKLLNITCPVTISKN